MANAIINTVKVSPLPFNNNSIKPRIGKPAHWKDAKATSFQNPWPSYEERNFSDVLKVWWRSFGHSPTVPVDIDAQIPSVRPTWGATPSNDLTNADKIKATWLGHACFLVELPRRSTSMTPVPSRGARILFDPVFNDRCSPFRCFGPKRYTKAPCEIADVPEIDAVVISHNHYDHLDVDTIRAFSKRSHDPHFFAPLGNKDVLLSVGIGEDKVHCLDWWEGRRIEVEVESSSPTNSGKSDSAKAIFDLTCTPSQHFSSRTLVDRNKALWGSWVVQEVRQDIGGEKGAKIYFAGDTGYRNIPEGAKEDEMPCCPAFKEIGNRFGGFDFAMIPIGAYEPRHFMSTMHCAPQDSVRLFQDIRAKKALGMHWGTWLLSNEEVTDPPRKLAEECKRAGIPREDFDVCKLGETLFF